MSVGQITDHDCRVILDPDICYIQDRYTGHLVGTGPVVLCAVKSPLLDLGGQRIVDIDDNEYIVQCVEPYQIAWLVQCVDSALFGISSWCLYVATWQFSLLVEITQRGNSYVQNGDWIYMQQNITSLVLVYALLQITDALFSGCKLQ
jgi:hypothetical protein